MAWCERTGYDPDGTEWGEDDKLEVDHIDKDRTNNHPSNLRWVTKVWNANGYRKKKEAIYIPDDYLVDEDTGEIDGV